MLESGRWVQTTRYEADSPEGQLQAVRRTLAEDRPEEALELADQWIERYPNHPQLVDAFMVRGDCKAALSYFYKALHDYEYAVRSFPASEQYLLALDREFEIAKMFASGLKRRWLGMRILPATGEAEEIMIRVQERAPGSDVGERASLELGEFYFSRSQWGNAAEAYDLFLTNYPDSRHREKAMRRMIQANLASFDGPRHDPTGLIDAAQRIKAFQQEFPTAAQRMRADHLLARVADSLANKRLYTAQWYDKQNKRVAATYLYRRLVREMPETTAGKKAAARLKELGVEVVEPPLDDEI